MGVRVGLNRDLDRVVAERIARPAVARLAERVRAEAADRAPDAKVWITSHDERVRLSHRETDGQMIPENLRYRLPAVEYVRKGRGPDGRAVNPGGGWRLVSGRWDLARRPRDADLPVHQSVNCRCVSVSAVGAVARSIHLTPVAVAGTRVSARVWSDFHRVVESEFGTSGDAGAFFMAGAVREVAALLAR